MLFHFGQAFGVEMSFLHLRIPAIVRIDRFADCKYPCSSLHCGKKLPKRLSVTFDRTESSLHALHALRGARCSLHSLVQTSRVSSQRANEYPVRSLQHYQTCMQTYTLTRTQTRTQTSMHTFIHSKVKLLPT